MNNEYYNPIYRQEPSVNNMTKQRGAPDIFIDDNFFLNMGHKGEFHMSFPDSATDRDRIFTGKIVEATADHISVHNEELNEWYLLPLMYLNYAITKEKPATNNFS